MRMMVGALLALLSLESASQAARTVTLEHAAPVPIRVEVHQPTQVIFPEPIVSVAYDTSGCGGSPDGKEGEPVRSNGPYIYIMACKEEFGGRFFALDHQGNYYALLIKVAAPADDTVILVKPKPTTAAQPFTPDSLLRALRNGVSLPTATTLDFPVPGLPDHAPLTLQKAQALTVGGLIGQTLTLLNTQTAPVVLDIRLGEAPAPGTVPLEAWAWPPQVQILRLSAQEELIPPGAQARVFIVYQARRP